MKRTSKFFLAGVVVIMAVCLSFGMTMGVAFAENRVFDDRFDSSFEEFGDLTGDITATGMTLEKPYLHVEFTAADSGTADDPIFKEGKGMDSASVVNIVFVRQPLWRSTSSVQQAFERAQGRKRRRPSHSHDRVAKVRHQLCAEL